MKNILLVIGAALIATAGGSFGYEYSERARADEIAGLQSKIEALEGTLAVEQATGSYLLGEAAKGVPQEDYMDVVNQYNALVAKYNVLVNRQSYAPTYNPVYCTSNSYSFTNTTYTSCY